ncbi:hypothetical protein [Bacillus sp. FJAT-27225]|uniref:hypothetical protein n=1 Tax=Bacillus sp. FJAT-27225 TaxID=1743144 RepID=UPI001585EC11|nr:hypothetical protein [Bacillus sp. FJAT-27225]
MARKCPRREDVFRKQEFAVEGITTSSTMAGIFIEGIDVIRITLDKLRSNTKSN